MKMKKKAVLAAAVFTAAMNFSACNNYNQDVYGPPPETWEQEETDMEIVNNDDTTLIEEETSYDPADNINGDVYGPPIDE